MWFAGSVTEAIGKTKTEGKLLLVFIEGPDEQSVQSRESLESIQEEILSRAVPIKLEAGSKNATDFGQFYPILVVPATYIITSAGLAVEVVAGAVHAEEFVSKLDKAGVQQQQLPIPTTVVSSPNAGRSSGNSTPSYAPSPVLTVPPPPSPASPAQPVLEEKLALAQRKLEELKAKKEKEEEEKERLREQERRETGKAVLTAKRRREEQEMLEAANQRKRDAQLEKDHRAKVLAQIEQDKQERKKRFAKQQQDSDHADANEVRTPNVLQQPVVASDQTKIQFRFPDGHTLTRVFQSEDKLQSARDFVAASESSLGPVFSLSLMYPRKTFLDEDLVQSFAQLGLVPTSVLLIIPKSGSSSSFRSTSSNQSTSASSVTSSSFLASYVPWFLLMPFFTLWNFVSSFLPTSVPPSQQEAQHSTTRGVVNNPRSSSQAPAEPQPSTSGLRRRDLPSTSSSNIHRLRDDEDSEDEKKKKKTWNGNSTQQM